MRDQVTVDDPVTCALCGEKLTIGTIVLHLATVHDIDPEVIANAPVVVRDQEQAQDA